jgi:hypothetical protein
MPDRRPTLRLNSLVGGIKMPRRETVLAAMAALLWIAAERQAFTAPGPPPVIGTGSVGQYLFNVRAATVPEPTSIGLLAVGSLSALIVAGRRRAKAAP